MSVVRLALSVLLVCAPTWAQAPVQEPQSLGFEAGQLGSLPRPWFVPPMMRGWRAELVAGDAAAGERFLRLHRTEAEASTTGNLMRAVPAGGFAGRRVRLAAQVRVEGAGRAQMWLRVDREGGEQGALDNMGDRPLRGDTWQPAVIELDVDGDAVSLAFGFLALGADGVAIDDVSLIVLGAAAERQPPTAAVALDDRELVNAVAASRLLGYLWFFHPSDALVELEREHWDPFAVALIDAALPATSDTDLAARLTAFVAPVAPGVQVWAGAADGGPPSRSVPKQATHRRYWEHRGAGRVAPAGSIYRSRVVKKRIKRPIPADDAAAAGHVVPLGERVHARVPVLVWGDSRHTLPPSAMPPGWHEQASIVLSPLHRTTRLAAAAQAWNVLQHFYPYWDVVDVDWAAWLPRSLQAAAVATDAAAQTEVLERLVAALHDGHGNVSGPAPRAHSFLPVAVRWLGDQLIVSGVAPGVADAHVGDVVETIDGRSVEAVFADLRQRISAATDGWARHRSQTLLAWWPTGDPVRLQLRHLDGSSEEVAVPRVRGFVPERPITRSKNGAAVADGIVYFDLNGASKEELEKCQDELAAAKGIVFDLRGYPDSAATKLLGMLLEERGQSAAWGVPIITRPDGEDWQWDENGRWRLRAIEPHLAAEIAFLTDGRAISYAESIMGVVEAYRLGEIVGATTAGTNGNVNPFDVAGGYSIAWTGMRVRKHDGSRHHGVGIAPTVPVTPTPAGVAAGRDEVLERAIEVLQQKLAR